MGLKLDPKKTTKKQLENFFDEKYEEIKKKQNEILDFEKQINEGKKVIEDIPTESSFSIISPKAAKEFIPSSSSKKSSKKTPLRLPLTDNNSIEIINNNTNNKINQENSQSNDNRNNYTNIISGNANQTPVNTPWPFANPPNPNNTPFSSPFTSIFSTPLSSFQENIPQNITENTSENKNLNKEENNNENGRLNSPSKLLAQFSPKRVSSPSRLSFQTPSSPPLNVHYPSLSSTLTDDLLSAHRSNNPLDETIDDLNDDLIDDGDGEEDVDDVDFAHSIPFSSPPLKKKNKLNKNDNNINKNNQKGGKKVIKKITKRRKPSSSSFFSSPLFILFFFLFAIITAIYLMSDNNNGSPIEKTTEQVNQQITRFLPYFAYSLRIQNGKYQCEESPFPYLDEDQTQILISENNYIFSPTDVYNYLRGQNIIIENTKLHVDMDRYSFHYYALDNPIFSYSCQFNRYFYHIIFSIIILIAVFVYTYYIRFVSSKLKKVEMILNNNPDGVQEIHLRDELFRSIAFNFLRDILMKLVTHRMRNDSRFAHTEQKQNNFFVPVWQFTNLND